MNLIFITYSLIYLIIIYNDMITCIILRACAIKFISLFMEVIKQTCKKTLKYFLNSWSLSCNDNFIFLHYFSSDGCVARFGKASRLVANWFDLCTIWGSRKFRISNFCSLQDWFKLISWILIKSDYWKLLLTTVDIP